MENMAPNILLSSYNDEKSLYAVFEDNGELSWLYLCSSKNDKRISTEVVGDVFVCNKVDLIENTELDRYKPNLPPITKGFGHPEAVCANIDKIRWELHWLQDTSILLTKDQNPWALISLGENRGMCKAIKKSGPWGNNWHEQKYRKLK